MIGIFDDDELRHLTPVYKLFFPQVTDFIIPQCFDQCAGERFGSRFSRLNRCLFVLAKWAARYDGEIDMKSIDLRPAVVLCFVKRSVVVDGMNHSFCFARVDWFKRHPDRFLCGPAEPYPEVGV